MKFAEKLSNNFNFNSVNGNSEKKVFGQILTCDAFKFFLERCRFNIKLLLVWIHNLSFLAESSIFCTEINAEYDNIQASFRNGAEDYFISLHFDNDEDMLKLNFMVNE